MIGRGREDSVSAGTHQRDTTDALPTLRVYAGRILHAGPPGVIEGIVKGVIAAASLFTAAAFYYFLRRMLNATSHAELKDANESLAPSHEKLERQSLQLAESNAALQRSVEALRGSEEKYRQLANSMPLIVWTATEDGSLDYYNERWYEFTGFKRSLTEEFSWGPVLHPDDLQKATDGWYAAVQSGAPYESEVRFWDRASENYRYYLCRAVSIKDRKGAVRWVGTSTDIDDHKRAQSEILLCNAELEERVAERTQELLQTNGELNRTQTWLQALLNSATRVGIMARDNEGIFTFFNSGAERLTGYTAQELIGRCTPRLLYSEEYCKLRARLLSEKLQRPVGVDELFLGVNQTPDPVMLDSVFLHTDGTPIDVNVSVTPMIDASGTRLGTLSIALDMRAQKTLERQLNINVVQLQEETKRAEDANRAKSDFLSAMSHEIRTPMNAILGMADLLWESELDSTQRKYVDVFKRAGANLLTLVNDILDLSKIESGHFELEQIDFYPEETVERTLELIRPKTHAKRIKLTCLIAPGTLGPVVGDPTRLQQILINLLGNAVKFTEAGEITLKVSLDATTPNRLHFEVTDTGVGIPESELERIFQDFTQSESSTTRRFGGTGLGLGICRRLVNCMGGQLHVRSEFGKGSSFYFDAVFAASSLDKLRHPEMVAGLVGRRVLIVDDNSTNRLIFAEMCRGWGMTTSECASAGAALIALEMAAVNEEAFELMIVDRLMRRGDGFALVSQVRQTFFDIPIIMTTSDNTPGEQTRGQQLGVSGYAVKPVRRADLLRLVCRALGTTDSRKLDRATNAELASSQAGDLLTGRILIAEDSDDNRFLLQEYLRNTGYKITFVNDGERALGAAGTQVFDLILMDMQMPVMDGLTATKLIREAEREAGRSAVPILALTANARKEDVEASRAAGCDAHVSKPISKPKLLSAIARHILKADADTAVGPPLIDVPEGLEEAAKRYLQSRKDELPRLTELVTEGHFDKLRVLAHNMKGTGTSFGFPDLTRLGGLLESSAKEQNAAVFSEHLLALSKYILEAEEAVKMLAG